VYYRELIDKAWGEIAFAFSQGKEGILTPQDTPGSKDFQQKGEMSAPLIRAGTEGTKSARTFITNTAELDKEFKVWVRQGLQSGHR
jgi:hypothetical protein